jgi:hypothetical protein
VVLYQIQAQMRTRKYCTRSPCNQCLFHYIYIFTSRPFLTIDISTEREKKLQNMDDQAMVDLALELEGDDTNDNDTKKKKLQQKKKAKVEQRLAAERKKFAKNKNQADADDDGDDDNLETFAKGPTKKKN